MSSEIPTLETPRFKRLLLNAVIVPIVMMIAIAILLVAQIQSLLAASAKAEHSDQVIAGVFDLEKLTIDMETGERGFLVAGKEDFLEPYEKAIQRIHGDSGASEHLRRLITDNPVEQRLLDEITTLRETWTGYAEMQIQRKRTGESVVLVAQTREGKSLMDDMRRHFAEFISLETDVRQQRDQKVQRASKLSLWLTGGVALLGGGILAALSRRQFLLLAEVYSRALATSNELNATLETRVVERTREVQLRSEQLSEANRELEAFAYSISHDLRAPMRHITGFADMLRQSTKQFLPSSDKLNLDTIYETAKLAGRMVDDLLAFSRVGRTGIKESYVDMNVLLDQCRKELQPEWIDRKIEWTIATLPPVTGDSALLKMMLLNLLSNAVKYTSKMEMARVEVGIANAEERAISGKFGEVAVRESDFIGETPEWVCFFVRDNGVGFDMQYATKLYGVFQRLHRAEEFEGTGIGLAHVRRIITRHDGRIWANSATGKGATFYFSLPAGERHQLGVV